MEGANPLYNDWLSKYTRAHGSSTVFETAFLDTFCRVLWWDLHLAQVESWSQLHHCGVRTTNRYITCTADLIHNWHTYTILLCTHTHTHTHLCTPIHSHMHSWCHIWRCGKADISTIGNYDCHYTSLSGWANSVISTSWSEDGRFWKWESRRKRGHSWKRWRYWADSACASETRRLIHH